MPKLFNILLLILLRKNIKLYLQESYPNLIKNQISTSISKLNHLYLCHAFYIAMDWK